MPQTQLTDQELQDSAQLSVRNSLINLEPNSILELFELYYDANLPPFKFHAGTNNLVKDIIWNGSSYYSTSIDVEGFESNNIGRLPRPKITIINTDLIFSSFLRSYSDLRAAKLVRIKTFLRYLDNENFDENINPFGQANPYAYISKEKYIFCQKLIENKQFIQFEMVTPFDVELLDNLSRTIIAKYCYWQYRGMGCNYAGNLTCKENDLPFSSTPAKIKNSSGVYLNADYKTTVAAKLWKLDAVYNPGDIVCIQNKDLNGLKDPPYSWFVCVFLHRSSKFILPNNSTKYWERDECSKTISACKKRFSNIAGYEGNDSIDVNNILPFGGFVATDNFRYE